MAIAFYFDEHIPGAITDAMRARRIDVVTAQEDDFRGVRDEGLLARSTELGRVLFSHDDDFLTIGNRWLREGRAFAGIVYVHQNRLTYGERIADLAQIATRYSPNEMINRIIFLPLP